MTRSRLFFALWMVCGLALTAGGLFSLKSADQLATDRNPFAVQRSAYGKLLARLSESTVDRVWHLGVEQIAPHAHGDDCGEDCGHDHDNGHEHTSECDHGHDCDHDHGEKVAHAHHEEHEHTHPAIGDEPELTHTHPHDHNDAHYHGEEIVFAVHDHDHGDVNDHAGHDHSSHANHDHGEHTHAEGEDCKWCEIGSSGSDESSEPIVDRTKNWLTHLSGMRYVRTNPRPMSQEHITSVKKDIERMLLRSYQMDPTHYGVYNSYHLFLTVHDFGGTEATKRQAKVIANHTIAHVFQENEDPEPWLTAGSAAMNLYLMETEHYQIAGEKVPLKILREYENKIGYCLQKFDELQEKSAKSGVWDNLSFDRQKEISDRHLFVSRTFEPFGALIARAEERENGLKASEAEVAEMLSVDGLED